MLYISTGDGADPNPPDPLNTGQDCSDLLSSVLRIDVDHKDAGKNYAVPKDNPFVGMKDVRPEIWAYGFRNPWRMSFDRKTGDLWVGDVGWELWEMVHKVEKGGNYGWSIIEGRQPIKPDQKPGPTPIRAADRSSCRTRSRRASPAGTSTAARSSRNWSGRTSSATGRRAASGRRGSTATGCKEMPEIVKPSVRVVGVRRGQRRRTVLPRLRHRHRCTRWSGTTRPAQNANFPTKLSETGLFADVKEHEPADGRGPVLAERPAVAGRGDRGVVRRAAGHVAA